MAKHPTGKHKRPQGQKKPRTNAAPMVPPAEEAAAIPADAAPAVDSAAPIQDANFTDRLENAPKDAGSIIEAPSGEKKSDASEAAIAAAIRTEEAAKPSEQPSRSKPAGAATAARGRPARRLPHYPGFWNYLFSCRRRPKGDSLASTPNYEWARMINHEYFRFFHSVRYRGLDNVPKTGPIIFAPNHVSYYDPTLVAARLPYHMRFMAWDALFTVPVLREILNTYGAYPVKLQSADKGSIERTLRILKTGQCVMIFPEGGRGTGLSLEKFEQGVARLALQTGATIVPVTITGMERTWPRNHMLPRWFRPLTVKYHPPIPVPLTHDRAALRQKLSEINEEIARAITRRLNAYVRLRARHEPASGVWLDDPLPEE